MRGPPAFLIVAAAALPCLLLVRFIYRFDRNRPEPRLLILKTFAAGLASPLPAVAVELVTIRLCLLLPAAIVLPAQAFLGIALPEELIKIAALVLVVGRRREFDEKLDGPVYGITAAMGFALLENILYAAGADDAMRVALLRGFTAVPLHALAGGFMGLALSRVRFESKGSLTGALLVAVLVHGGYDWILMDPAIPSGLIFLLLAGGWAVLIVRLRAVRRDDAEAGRTSAPPFFQD